ncbi:hypothetical protein TNIN_329511 [Trichonephila inaurata madagascariensis]|uniref:Uncharacterized protein n=1 Tax=Trichonephila inaurata madagascariensis TaxID=2747483 RepID=A0A8X7CEU1_9ARAC|nr:hypothetical protein TNIN_329511 [Trichonephila inaurata madagascariensis]
MAIQEAKKKVIFLRAEKFAAENLTTVPFNDDDDHDAHDDDHGDDPHDGRDDGGDHDVRDGHDDGGDRDVHDGRGGDHGDHDGHDDDALHQ